SRSDTAIAVAQFDRPMAMDVFFDERAGISKADLRRMFHSPPARHSLATLVSASYRTTGATLGIPELSGLNCPTGTGSSLVIGALWPSPHGVGAGERGFWAPIAHHLASQ